MTNSVTPDQSAALAQAIELLQKGECVAIPTETVYGLAANAFDPKAVARIFLIKNRPAFDPLIVHIGKIEDAGLVASEMPPLAKKLAARFWPGPLTLVLPKHKSIPDLVTAGLDTVGVRMPDHPLALELLRNLDFPLAAPSANPFGFVSPTSAQHVRDQLGDKVACILDGGPCEVGIESTIVSFSGGKVKVLRLGGISVEDIESITGLVEVATQSSSNPTAPGMLISHYSPGKPVYFGDLDHLIRKHKDEKFCVLAFRDTRNHSGFALSESGEFLEAAQQLFSMLRKLAKADCDIILAEELPDIGLGRAINDRLRRSAGKGI
jgi:L-threonylcarbamoyladenylate synthase